MLYNYICIEGNIGAGKTSLATKIAADTQAKLILERFEDNSFLPKFYENPRQYAFPLELSFLADRYQQLKEQLTSELFVPFTISDYFIAKSLIFAQKTLESDEFTLYRRLFDIIISALPKPDLYVYLYVDIEKLKRNISKRGRTYEQNIQPEYLEKIQAGYLDYFKYIPEQRILIIDVNNIDFVNNADDYRLITETIFKPYDKGLHRVILKNAT
ncbi:MAG: deoxynucleoside kinase [Lentimicrobiaceae bacterium]|nr:deoxynucleoside kinase [Lentimicrobiaceae bacterium]